MVRVISFNPMDTVTPYIEAAGLSTDDKPVNCCTGSVFIEVDTGKVYLFDEVSADWTELGQDGGSQK